MKSLYAIAIMFFCLVLVSRLSLAATTSATPYTEQLGMTRANNATALAYNVTAVAQSDSNGYGPAYLLSGYSDKGYMYKIGLAYNWSLVNGGHNAGFTPIFTVFAPNGTITTSGLSSFSNGRVNPGDEVLLNLYFRNGHTVMLIKDWNTGAYANYNYTSAGATKFLGNPNATTSAQGYSSGLVTEWHHENAYYGTESPVLYSPYGYTSGPAWLWITEYTSATTLFNNATTTPVTPVSAPFILCAGGTGEEYFPSGNFLTGLACTGTPYPKTTVATTTQITTSPTTIYQPSPTQTSWFNWFIQAIDNFFGSILWHYNSTTINSTTTSANSTLTTTSTITSTTCLTGTWIGSGTYYELDYAGNPGYEVYTKLIFNLTQVGDNVSGGYQSFPISQQPTQQGIKDGAPGAPEVGGSGATLTGTVSGGALTLTYYGITYGGRSNIEQWTFNVASCSQMSGGVTNLDTSAFTGHSSTADAFSLTKLTGNS
jgi:hypothetical protein